MILYPAIDLMDGKVVRLERGEAERKTVYSDDPAAMGRRWENEGGDWLHVVDLDAAFGGVPKNLDKVREIVAAVSIPVELGGGMRDLATVRAAFDAGVSRVVIGTRAVESFDFIRELVAEFGGERIAVGIDARDGMAAVKGWTETSSTPALELAVRVVGAGVGTIIYTDIATDGMFTGPNVPALKAMLEAVSCQVIASGGVSCLEDIRALAGLTGLHGVITGKALYDGRLDLSEAAAVEGVGI